MKLQPLIVSPAAYFELIMQPSFADVAPDYNGYYSSTLSEWTLMDNVPLDRGIPVVDIFQKQNFLKRKDASCKTDWSTVATTDKRKITVDELYAAVEDCQEEFYTGAMKDFRDQAPRFRDYIMQIFKKGTNIDILSNGYFGDPDRADDSTGQWSWNKYEGIVSRIQKAIDSGALPAGQVLPPMPSGAITPTQAHDYLKLAFESQSDLMQTLPDLDKAFYVDKRFAAAYSDYLISTGMNTTNSIMYIQNGVPALQYNGVPIMIEPLWNPILNALNEGTEAHMLILTFRGNFVFGTNKKYGGGANLDQAMKVWYSDDDDVWRRKAWFALGTFLANEQHIVFGVTNIG